MSMRERHRDRMVPFIARQNISVYVPTLDLQSICNLPIAEPSDDGLECPPDRRSYLSAVQFTVLYACFSISSISRAGMSALRYSRHPGPDSRLPSRHVACPTCLGHFRSVSRRSAVVGLSSTSISASGRRTARHGTVLSA